MAGNNAKWSGEQSNKLIEYVVKFKKEHEGIPFKIVEMAKEFKDTYTYFSTFSVDQIVNKIKNTSKMKQSQTKIKFDQLEGSIRIDPFDEEIEVELPRKPTKSSHPISIEKYLSEDKSKSYTKSKYYKPDHPNALPITVAHSSQYVPYSPTSASFAQNGVTGSSNGLPTVSFAYNGAITGNNPPNSPVYNGVTDSSNSPPTVSFAYNGAITGNNPSIPKNTPKSIDQSKPLEIENIDLKDEDWKEKSQDMFVKVYDDIELKLITYLPLAEGDTFKHIILNNGDVYVRVQRTDQCMSWTKRKKLPFPSSGTYNVFFKKPTEYANPVLLRNSVYKQLHGHNICGFVYTLEELNENVEI